MSKQLNKGEQAFHDLISDETTFYTVRAAHVLIDDGEKVFMAYLSNHGDVDEQDARETAKRIKQSE
jgi:hypothetical protein